ncbi:MAG: glycoside hydrolase domain-containing protein [Tuberibacillus sp.]
MENKSKWFQFILTWVFIICVTAISIELINIATKNHDNKPFTTTHQQPSEKPKTKPPAISWGVDTASKIDQKWLQCVNKNYGKPIFAGRYLGSNGDASTGLSKEEIQYLHGQKIKILPIHNKFNKATGLENGQAEAKEAVQLAKAIGAKNGIIIVADIEPKYPVNADFIIGWTKTILDNKFIPGVYGNLDKDELKNAYSEAAKKDQTVKEKLILWTNQPMIGITNAQKAPKEFKGATPNADKTYAWQYGIEGKQCHIDTDIAKGNLLELLW